MRERDTFKRLNDFSWAISRVSLMFEHFNLGFMQYVPTLTSDSTAAKDIEATIARMLFAWSPRCRPSRG